MVHVPGPTCDPELVRGGCEGWEPSPIHIDVYEVSVADYRACVDAGACTALGRGQICRVASEDLGDDYPVNCVDWGQADTFCAWAGKRLPTGTEWQRAAGVDHGWNFPWGNQQPTCELTVLWTDWSNSSRLRELDAGCGTGGPLPVGSRPRGISPYGVHDMAGNVAEWVQDVPRNIAGDPEVIRATRGGGWWHHDAAPLAIRSEGGWTRYGNPNDLVGFRCASSCEP
jgi:iron(II)-dependent oxidoreductase